MLFSPIELVEADAMEPEDLRFEIAILAGQLAHKTSAPEAAAVLINIAKALEPGGRA